MAMVQVPGAPKDETPPWMTPPAQTAQPQRAPAPVNYGQPSQNYAQPTQSYGQAAPTTAQPVPVTTNSAPTYTPDQPTSTAPTAGRAPAPTNNSASYDAINGFYQKYLGRAASPEEAANWSNGTYGASDLAGIEKQIAASGEASDYARNHGGAPGGGDGSLNDYLHDPAQLLAWVKQQNPSLTDAEAQYYAGKIQQQPGQNAAEQAGAKAYWGDLIRRKAGGDSGGGGGYGGTNVFSDPATANFEKLLNDLIGRFTTPQTPPDYQASIDQMKKYLERLNGPVYTPAQMELQQTQAWDPMQQQHDAARQQLIARLGSQGINPGSGIAEKALEDLDRQFQQAHTTTQANFANQAIGLDRQNAATAAGLAPQISNFEQAQTGWQDQRALQGASLAALIPQMAMQRLSAANSSIQPLNPMSLLTMLQSFQNQGYNQGANYGSNIMQLLAQLFGMGGQ